MLSEGESVDIKVFASSSIAAMTSFLSDSARKDSPYRKDSHVACMVQYTCRYMTGSGNMHVT